MITIDEISQPDKLIDPGKLSALYATVRNMHPSHTEHHAARAEIEGRFALYAALTQKAAAETALAHSKSAGAVAERNANSMVVWARALVFATLALVVATAVLAWTTAVHK